MLEVDSLRRNFNIGHYEPNYFATHHPHPMAGFTGAPPASLDTQGRGLVHWNQPPVNQSTKSTGGSKSDEDDDDDSDEDRPFTPPPPRERLSYTRYQLQLLSAIFLEVRYPNSTQKLLIAKRVGITREQVKIWFQNRRRKDVVGPAGKIKSCDTSTSSTGSSTSKDSEQQLSPAADGNESSSSDETRSNSPKDAEENVVPDLVMKSVISELLKFVNDPSKGKKNKKKKKSNKQKEKAAIKKGLSATLLAGSYDMISPPNQVTPSAFFDKVKTTGFNHSKAGSAFACPRDPLKPAQISSVSSTSENTSVFASNSISIDAHINAQRGHGHQLPFPFQGYPGHFLHGGLTGNNIPLHFPHGSTNPSAELPVLSDMLSYKQNMESRQKDTMTSRPAHLSSAAPPVQSQANSEHAKKFHHNTMNNLNSTRPMNGIFPFPFLAEQPLLLSSLRQPDQIFRPAPYFPMSHYGDDPYQPLLLSSLSNPYYSPPSATWKGSTTTMPSQYTQL